MLVVCLLESTVYGLSEAICVKEFEAVDMGGSIYVHMFGGYFGCVCSWVYTDKAKLEAG